MRDWSFSLRCLLGFHDAEWFVGPIGEAGKPAVEDKRCGRCGKTFESHGEQTLEEFRAASPDGENDA